MRVILRALGWRRCLALGFLAALPIVLGWVLRERASWRPRTLRTGLAQAFGVGFSRDGGRLAVLATRRGGGEGVLQIWDAAGANFVAMAFMPHGSFVGPLLSPDGRLVACIEGALSSEGNAWIWDTRDGQLVRKLEGVSEIAFVPDGGSFYTLNSHNHASWQSREPDVKLRNARTMRVLEAHDIKAPHGLSFFDKDGAGRMNWSLAPLSHSLALELWSQELPGSSAYGEPRGALLVSLRSGQKRMLPILTNEGTSEMVFSRDEDLLATATIHADSEVVNYSTLVQVWHRASGRLKWKWQVPGEWTPLAWTPDKSRLLMQGTEDYGRFGKMTVLRDAATGCVQTSLHARDVERTVLLSPTGALIASAGVHIKESASGAYVSDPRALLWDARTGKVARRLIGHRAEVNDVAWSPDGSTLATASLDGTVKLWRVR